MEADANGDGAINFSELLTLMAKKPEIAEVADGFSLFGKDQDGSITAKEL